MNTAHPWEPLEEKLQQIRVLALSENGQNLRMLWKLIDSITPQVLRAASRMVNCPRRRHLRIHARDMAQQFWLNMLRAAFRAYDPKRGPLFPYAYRVLAFTCSSDIRKTGIRQTLPLVKDRPDLSKPTKTGRLFL
jgi:hypothetical protein